MELVEIKLKNGQVWKRLQPRNSSPLETQCNIAVENLIQKYYPLVHKWMLSFTPENELDVKDTIESVVAALEELSLTKATVSIEDSRPEYAFLGEDLVITLEPKWQSDWDDLSQKEIPTGACPTIKVSIYYTDLEILTKIEEVCVEKGLRADSEGSGPKLIPVTFAFPSGYDSVDFRVQSIERIPLEDITQNYQSQVIETAKSLIIRSKEVSHGMVLLNGPVGTGKSYLIRALLSEIRSRQAVVCSPPTLFLKEAGLLSQATSRSRRSIIILEDIGEVVASDSPSNFMDARANLLNLTEGLLSLLMDSIILISFNYDIAKLDPAITRDGRCIAQIETKNLCYKQAQGLLDFRIEDRSYTLAEIYEMRRTGISKSGKGRREFGF